ncbi:uncharacterized protein LOC142024640 isoform X3 [Carettochelys insculpta]|uniref:uncharacterized protein LOC142024640 isoform X3 n=1 Tax=Carettochelys insculpta TaxID=44489 RepID=UPI003EB977A5
MSSLRFKKCASCHEAMPASDGHSECIRCLRETHVPQKCPHCSKLTARARKDREMRLKMILFDKALQPEPAEKPHKEGPSGSHKRKVASLTSSVQKKRKLSPAPSLPVAPVSGTSGAQGSDPWADQSEVTVAHTAAPGLPTIKQLAPQAPGLVALTPTAPSLAALTAPEQGCLARDPTVLEEATCAAPCTGAPSTAPTTALRSPAREGAAPASQGWGKAKAKTWHHSPSPEATALPLSPSSPPQKYIGQQLQWLASDLHPRSFNHHPPGSDNLHQSPVGTPMNTITEHLRLSLRHHGGHARLDPMRTFFNHGLDPHYRALVLAVMAVPTILNTGTGGPGPGLDPHPHLANTPSLSLAP